MQLGTRRSRFLAIGGSRDRDLPLPNVLFGGGHRLATSLTIPQPYVHWEQHNSFLGRRDIAQLELKAMLNPTKQTNQHNGIIRPY